MTRLIVMLLLFGAQVYGQTTSFLVPQFGHGSDAFGNLVTTSVSFINLANTTNRVTVEAFSDDGQPASLLSEAATPFAQERSVAVAGAEMAVLGFAQLKSLNSDPSPGALEVGWVHITSTAEMAVEVIFSISNLQGDLLTSTSVLPREPSGAASFIAEVSSSANTGVALLNPPAPVTSEPAGETEDAFITIQVVDTKGRVEGEETLVLVPGEKIAVFLSELVEGLDDFLGTFELRSSLPVAILPLRQEGIQLTTQEVHPPREMK